MPDVGPDPSHLVALAVLLVLLLGGVWVVGEDASDGPACREPQQDVPAGRGLDVPANDSTANATLERVGPETIRYTYGNLSGMPEEFGPSVPAWLQALGVRIQSAKGFALYRNEEGTRLVRNVTGPDPQVTVRTVPSSERGGLDSAGAAITPDWAFIPLLPHGVPTNVSLAPGQPGVVGDQVLLLGDHRTVRREVDCQEIVLHVPMAVDAAEVPETIADTLAEAGEHLDLGLRYETVRVFGVGDPVRPGGRAFTHEIWVHAGTTFEPGRGGQARYPPSPFTGNVWLHEYVHTLQRPHLNETASPEGRWLTEAVPSYYAIAEDERQDHLDPCNASAYWDRLNRSLHLGPGTVNLSEPRTYLQTGGQYTRGAYVLAALDVEVRARTGGLRSLQNVLRRIATQGNTTAADFQSAVRETAGPGLEAWLDRHVSGTSIPPPPPRPLQCTALLESPSPVQFALILAVLGVAAAIAGRFLGAVLFG